ncbi:hypothetical protein [Microbacterium resistens]|uniref:hypothetical protein n=1 Tax=Microbacterium resistens TaxID=156977 RepID=UPI001C57B33F|nr:hypothetical protein [Microbacterium resistens]
MTNEDPDARSRRRTWVAGGLLLVLSAVVALVARGPLAGIHLAKDALWALGVLVLVIGLGRAGSLTARRPVATVLVILQVVLASPWAARFVSGFVLDDPANPHAEESSWKSIVFPYQVVLAVLTVVVVLLIGIIRAWPRFWSWAPAGGLVVWVVVLAAGFLSPVTDSRLLGFALVFLPPVLTALLGGIAIVLGLRAAPASRPRVLDA